MSCTFCTNSHFLDAIASLESVMSVGDHCCNFDQNLPILSSSNIFHVSIVYHVSHLSYMSHVSKMPRM